MDQKEAKRKAREVYQWLQEAVGDVAYDIATYPDPKGDKWYKRAYKIKQMLIRDRQQASKYTIGDILADELYSDADTVSDLIGDRIYDLGKTEEERVQIAIALMDNAHSALEKACKEFIKRRDHKQ